MWMSYCLLCAFTFPEPTEADRIAIREALSPLTRPPLGRVWSEAAGPYTSERIQLLTPEFGIVHLLLTWRAGSITMQARSGTTLFVAKKNGAWRVVSTFH